MPSVVLIIDTMLEISAEVILPVPDIRSASNLVPQQTYDTIQKDKISFKNHVQVDKGTKEALFQRNLDLKIQRKLLLNEKRKSRSSSGQGTNQSPQPSLLSEKNPRPYSIANLERFMHKIMNKQLWKKRHDVGRHFSVGLTHEDCALVRASWRCVCTPRDSQDCFPLLEFSDKFYQALFTLRPETKILFGSMSLQGLKLSKMLHMIVDQVEFLVNFDVGEIQGEKEKSQFKRMVQTHKRVGITREMLICGGQALLQALTTRLGCAYKRICIICSNLSTECVCDSKYGDLFGSNDTTNTAYSLVSREKKLTNNDATAWLLAYGTVADAILNTNKKHVSNLKRQSRVYEFCMQTEPELMRIRSESCGSWSVPKLPIHKSSNVKLMSSEIDDIAVMLTHVCQSPLNTATKRRDSIRRNTVPSAILETML